MMSLNKESFIQIFVENSGEEAKPQSAPKMGKFNAFPKRVPIPVDKKETGLKAIRNFSRDLLARLFEASFEASYLTGERNIIPRLSAGSLHNILPEKADFLERTSLSGPKYVISVEIEHERNELFSRARSLFRDQGRIDCLEDVADRVANEIIQAVKTDTRDKDSRSIKADPEDILVAIAVKDDREKEKPDQPSPWLISYYSKLADSDSLEVFRLEERVRYWDPNTRDQHLGSMFERQFQKLPTDKWHDAFLTSEERKKAEKLVGLFSEKKVSEKDIQNRVVDLLEEIARGYGLKKNKQSGSRLVQSSLPENHEIGLENGDDKNKKRKNPFPGLIVRDAEQRLLGYIIYCLDDEEKAQKLRENLSKNNRFHNVLLVYPDSGQLEIELYQGTERLEGRLRQNHLKFYGPGRVVNILSRYFVVSRAKVKNPAELAQELAYRARYLRDLAQQHLDDEPNKGALRDLFNRFKEALVHDIDEKKFADAYAQTLTYGLLTARLVGKDDYDPNKRFTRERALENFPSTSPFLHEFFQTVFKATFEDRLTWLTDDIADLLDRTDLDKVFGEGDKDSDENSDPIIHFYEPFLGAYDAELRKSMGVYYTPKPVVSFIVRSVHEALQKEFGLEDGLASTITWGEFIKNNPETKLPEHATDQTPFVQILDPATGTATFLVEVIDVIHKTMLQKWQKQNRGEAEIAKLWQEYVEKHLIPRVHGFELMMAPYAIAHLKFGLKLQETGIDLKRAGHAQIYLTNSLEMPLHDGHQKLLDLNTDEMSNEARAVTELKEKGLFTIIIGNPPYCGESKFKGKWIMSLMEDYKKEPGGEEKLKEANYKFVNDDYVKFLRFGQNFIEKTFKGVLSFINPHGFIDNPTFRGMRWSIKNTFNSIWILDLNGNAKKNVPIKGAENDENVFAIQQGVSIVSLIKGSIKYNAKSVHFQEKIGLRVAKLKFLIENSFYSFEMKEIESSDDFLFFKPMDHGKFSNYLNGVPLNNIFETNSLGLLTKKDHFIIDFSSKSIKNRLEDFFNKEISNNDLAIKYQLSLRDKDKWDLSLARKALLESGIDEESFRIVNYRCFDKRFLYYDPRFVARMNTRVLGHFDSENLGLISTRQLSRPIFNHVFVTDIMSEQCFISNKTKEGCQVFPLYLYFKDSSQNKMASSDYRESNFKEDFIKRIEKELHLEFRTEALQNISKEYFCALDLFDYIYGFLHSQKYRNEFSKFLQSDFPRVFLPSSQFLFWDLVSLGREMREFHLLKFGKKSTKTLFFKGEGNNLIEFNPKHVDGKIFINNGQYFFEVEEKIWNVYIGAYQPAQKWLKDRKGRVLTEEDIDHYQKIIVALTETDRIMKEIDEIIEKHGGLEGAFASGDED